MNIQEKRKTVQEMKSSLKMRMRQEEAKFRNKLKKIGVCQRCKDPGKPLASETMCRDCLDAMSAYAKSRYVSKPRTTKGKKLGPRANKPS